MRKVLVIGATSAIAQAAMRHFAAAGDDLFLVARNADKLQAIANDIEVRGGRRIATATLDATDCKRHEALIDEAVRRLGGLDTVLIAYGALAEQASCQSSFEMTRQAFESNALSVISWLTHLAQRFEQQGYGTLCVITSVAGDRGRQSNYVYGAAKAAVNVFMQGLRNRLHASAVQVLTVKPGLVDTPMTAAFAKGLLWSTPEVVGRGIYKAIQKKRQVVYLPSFWYPIMLLIRAMPEAIFKRLRL
jgi:short-subunit dehydrogenase